jgi:hypothetical protein
MPQLHERMGNNRTLMGKERGCNIVERLRSCVEVWIGNPQAWKRRDCFQFGEKGHLRLFTSGLGVEAAGIAPASREASVRASTCVADRLVVGLGAPVGRVPFGLSCYEFNSSRNKRLGSSDPELASPVGSLGRRPVAGPWLFLRQPYGDQQCCWQLSFGRLFTRPADQPRHATVHFRHPVDPGSPPNLFNDQKTGHSPDR